MKKLTDAAIKAARCPEGKNRLELSDASCPGLILRVTKTGSKTFLFKYWSPLLSKTVGLTLGAYPDVGLAAGRAKVADHRKTISLDEDPRRIQRAQRRQAAREEELSFDYFADLYIAEYVKGPGFPERPNKKSWQNDVGYLKRPRAEWGKLPAAAVTDDDVAELLDVISETAPVSANRTQSVLHTMFKWGKQPGRKYVPSNPLAEMSRRGGRERKRDRVLSDEEIRTLWWGLDRDGVPGDRHVCLAIRMILTTMVRPYQAAGAEINELFDLGTSNALYDMPPGRVKKDRAVIVPLSDMACAIIDEAIEDKKQKVLFPSKFDNTLSTSIARASISQALNGKKNGTKKNGKTEDRIGIREFLGMKHFTAHDLRRTAATIARRASAPRPDVKALLDHVNGDVTDVYDKYDMLPEKRAVVNILAAELRRIIGIKPATPGAPS
ncbi:tyrosine-type recombinase/integrase [Bradyrhizobium erythrophlei]|uniref:Site-specific recombinase XerD n=1 Tax=Bradyrhizobium erythrophlei TaxID=1437360 RepID=A0A1M5SB94_9BRAD|nr:integrase arm-type DNA-binding domain-containing protein [Bradyrhizobium erythrophlei]SHH35558.1 Site-specific recombinase XerD [Bradyrhizobium erythrophlei]